MEMYGLFERQVAEYHKTDSVDAGQNNPYGAGTFEALLWEKSWVDTVQWHLDASNQHRTDLVERIDDHYMMQFKDVAPQPDAKLNTETPAWAVDRLSILALKVYHFGIEAGRGDAEHRAKCQAKLDTLLTQRADLTTAIDQLLDDLAAGRRVMKLYRQMKMYNDPSLNPMLYKK